MIILRKYRILGKLQEINVLKTCSHLPQLQQQQQRTVRGVPKAQINKELLPASYQNTINIAEAASKDQHVPQDTTTSAKSSVDSLALENDEADSLEVVKEKPNYVPTFNLAAYVNKSPTLQQLLHLGVNLSRIERRKGLAEFVLKLNFEKDIAPYLLFLKDQGVSADAYGDMITKNPLLFKVDLDDLQTRMNYLEAKNFNQMQRARIVTNNPYWLMFSTRRIDRRLGHFQQEFKLSGDQVRALATKQPRLITYNMEHIRQATFCIREEMGFKEDELKRLLLSKPRLWMMTSDELIERFSYAHNEMQLSHDMLLQFPEVLCSREFRLKQRHEFLKMLGRAQYNPTKDLYVSPKAIVEGTDYYFVREIAKSNLETYELFCKTR